jgi:hypothetical protein
MLNNSGAADARKLLTGKNGAFYNGDGVMLATVESYQAQLNVTNAKYQPLGDCQEHESFSSFAVSLTMSQVVIEDDEFIKDLFKAMKTGSMPSWNFQGVLQGRNGSEERVIYRDCVPTGNIDIQNVAVGDVIKRTWNLTVNTPPDLQKFLTAA